MSEPQENTNSPTTPRMTSQEPILAVPDVPAATRYYHDVLGFSDVWLWGEPPTHGGVRRDEIGFQFSRNPVLAIAAEGHEFCIFVRNIEALVEQHRAAGAEIVSPFEAKPWGMREYTVRDLNGYRLRFGEGGIKPPASQQLPPEVQIVPHLPTWEDMAALNRAVGWADFTNFEVSSGAVENAVFGVSAIANGQTIGCAALMTDHAGFYYVRDVIVHPDWQGRHVGTALMKALMEYLNTHAPDHSLVGLFTGANLHDFYAQFGFRGPINGLYGMTLGIRRATE